jgi:hypothetical protein
LAIALLTIGMGVNSTSAVSGEPAGLNFTPIPPPLMFAQSRAACDGRCAQNFGRCGQNIQVPPGICHSQLNACLNACRVANPNG